MDQLNQQLLQPQRKQSVNRKNGGPKASFTPINANSHKFVETSPSKKARSKMRRKTNEMQNQIYGSQDRGRASIASGATFPRQSHLAQFSGAQMTSAFTNANSSPHNPNSGQRNSIATVLPVKSKSKIKEQQFSPRQARMQINKSQQGQNPGRYLVSSQQTSYKNQKIYQGALSSLGAQRMTPAVSHTLHRQLIYKQRPKLKSNLGAIENDSTSNMESQATHKWMGAVKMNETDFAHKTFSRDQSQSDYMKYQHNLQMMNHQSEMRNVSRKNTNSIFGQTKINNAKSIGILDLRKHLKKNQKRVLSSKHRTQDSSFDMLLAHTNVDPVISLIDSGQHNLWANNRQNNMALKQSNSGNIDKNWPQASMTQSNKNLYSQAEAATTITTNWQGAPIVTSNGIRETLSGNQSKTNFNSLDQEYAQTVQRNQRMCANSQFDKFLQEKFLASEAARRAHLEKANRERNQIRINAKTTKEKIYSGKSMVKSNTPSYIEDHKGSKESVGLSQVKAQRQIDTNQMLSDLRQSIRARDQTIVMQQQHESLGEKMSLAGEMSINKRNNLINISTFDNKSKQLSIQSESGQETYSSKQYKVNPLLLDDQLVKQSQAAPSEPSFDMSKDKNRRSVKRVGSNEVGNLRSSYNDNYQMIDVKRQKSNQRNKEEHGRDSIVLQLEPKSLERSNTNSINITIPSKQIKKPQQFQEFMKVDESYRQSQNINQRQGASNNFESASYALNKNETLKSQQIKRETQLHDKYNNFSQTVKPKDRSKLLAKRQNESERNYEYDVSSSTINQQVMSRQSNMMSIASSIYQKRQVKDAHSKQAKKKLSNAQTYTIGSLPQDYRKFNAINELQPRLRISNNRDLKTKGAGFSKAIIEKYSAGHIGVLTRNQQILTGKLPNEMQRIKKQNLKKVDKKQFDKLRVRSAKKPYNVQRNLQPLFQKDDSLERDKADFAASNLQYQINNQKIKPGTIGLINQNSSTLFDKDFNLIRSPAKNHDLASFHGRSIPRVSTKKHRDAERSLKKSHSQSKAQTGHITPISRSVKQSRALRKQQIEQDSDSKLEFVRNESRKTLNKISDRVQNQPILDIRIKNSSTPDRGQKSNIQQRSLDNQIEPRSFSNKDYSSPDKGDRAALDERSSQNSEYTQQRRKMTSLSVRRIKRNNQNNTKSETFLLNNQRIKSHYSNFEGYQGQNDEERCEKCEVVKDAQLAALNYVQPQRYKSQLGSQSPDRPSMQDHLSRTGKRPQNYRSKRALSDYPAFEKEVRQSAEHYTPYARSLYQNVGMNRKRALSAKDVDIRGLKYKFKVTDITKYTDKLKYGIFNWPVRYTTLGGRRSRKQPQKETLVKEIHFDTLLRILKETDWMQTPLYQQYVQFGRWKNDDEEIYSEIEINYLSSTLHQMDKGDDVQEFKEGEGQAIIKKHWSKTMTTLQKLMTMMNMMYYYEKLKLQFQNFEGPSNKPSVDLLEKLLSRCKKLYDQIDQFMKIFKLIEVKQLRDSQKEKKAKTEMSDKDIKKDEIMIKRLTVAICLLLKEHPVLPLSFKFGGQCILQQLKRERDQLKQLKMEIADQQD